MAWFAWKRWIDQNLSESNEGDTMAVRTNRTDMIPNIGDKYAVVIGGKLHQVLDLLPYGPATHAFYRHGYIWRLRMIAPLTRDELFAALEYTLAHDPSTLHITELR